MPPDPVSNLPQILVPDNLLCSKRLCLASLAQSPLRPVSVARALARGSDLAPEPLMRHHTKRISCRNQSSFPRVDLRGDPSVGATPAHSGGVTWRVSVRMSRSAVALRASCVASRAAHVNGALLCALGASRVVVSVHVNGRWTRCTLRPCARRC